MELASFFLIVPLGMEKLATSELRLRLMQLGHTSPTLIKEETGGLTLELPWEVGLKLNAVVKIPVRILWKLTEFKARDFPKLYQKLANLNWHQWLTHPHPEWKVSCHESRLMHTDRISETATDALAHYFKGKPLSNKWEKENTPAHTLYLRFVKDDVTLSIDTSGEPLYKRGLSSIKGPAPLRENLAAGLIFWAMQEEQNNWVIYDPMCGSATILTEALNFKAANRLRSYAFQDFPTGKSIGLKGIVPLDPPWSITHAHGRDIDGELLSKVKAGLKLDNLLLDTGNIFTEVMPSHSLSRLLIVNPPYNDRLTLEGDHLTLLTQLRKSAERVVILLPTPQAMALHSKQKSNRRMEFFHGGLSVTALLYS